MKKKKQKDRESEIEGEREEYGEMGMGGDKKARRGGAGCPI
jgi:hypothetical protein